jgi:chromate transporter
MAVFLGHRRAGFWGALLAGIGLILPATVIIMLLASQYADLQKIQQLNHVFLAMQAAALGLIFVAIRTMAHQYLKSFLFWVLLIFSAVLFFRDILPEALLIVLGGLIAVMAKSQKFKTPKFAFFALAAAPMDSTSVLQEIFWICFKAGAFVFGSGLAIVPTLEADFVTKNQWLTHAQFMDALVIGQITPGPVLLTTTFMGYLVAHWQGALVATGSIFLASFVHMSTWFPRAIDFLSRQSWIKSFVLGTTAAVVGCLLITAMKLQIQFERNWFYHLITLVVIFLSLKTKWPSWLLILLGAIAGLRA